ncbi:hypothetical protein BUALT_Bualt08G0074700 [Buddleja alternifolia]|uniref:DUF4283 domain-containing protein n=1 Tax=Buddleja alternifolia TaxID=168488 RepID=A0AAV6X5X8_9LAMI|nr:hypothetical protein BUALT_Bualt08G0074700 [Buddleja alternifolia]
MIRIFVSAAEQNLENYTVETSKGWSNGGKPPWLRRRRTRSYAEKLKGTISLTETVERLAKKAFVEGVDSKVIGTSTMVNGRQTIFVSKEEDDYMATPYQYSLVGKFSHGYPTMTRLRAKFAALGLNKVLKWTSEFDPTEESPIMPVWIKVFVLRPHWFHRQFLYHVASLIGKPLKLDEATTEIANPMFARMCVEINVLDKLVPNVPIQIDGKTRFFKVTYEGIPAYCKICHHRGHTMAACFERNEKDEQEGEWQINMDKESQSVKEDDLREILQRKQGKEPMIGQDNGSKDGVVKEKYFTTSSSKNDVGTSKSNRKYIQKDNTLNSDDETSKNIQDSPRIDPKVTEVIQEYEKSDQEYTDNHDLQVPDENKNPNSLDNIRCYKEIEWVRRDRDLAITESMEGEDLNNQLVLLGTEVMAPEMIESEDASAPDNSENPWQETEIDFDMD